MCEIVWFFSWVNTHPFHLKFVAFCPKFIWDSYVEFQGKTILGDFFRNFVQIKAILYQNFRNFALLSTILFWVRITLKKFTQVLSYVLFTQVRRRLHKKIIKRRYEEERPWRFVFQKTSFVHSCFRTYYALLLGYFGLKLLQHIPHWVY